MLIKITDDQAKTAVKYGTEVWAGVCGQQGYTVNRDSLGANQVGIAGEMAVCNYLGTDWTHSGFEDRGKGDVGKFEVRTTPYKTGRLLLNERDKPKLERKFILVITLGNLEFDLKGWAYGHEVIKEGNEFVRPQFVEDIWAIEQDKLRPMEELIGSPVHGASYPSLDAR